jgi:phosphoglycerol transferase
MQFGRVDLMQVVFHLHFADIDKIATDILVFFVLFLSILFFLAFYFRRFFSLTFSFLSMLAAIGLCFVQFNMMDIVRYYTSYSSVYEKHYVCASEIEYHVPQKLKNIVFIRLESMESTFENTALFSENLIPEITKLKSESVVFNGYKEMPGTAFTAGAVGASMLGVPLSFLPSFNANCLFFNDYHHIISMFSGIRGGGDIFKENGYKMVAMKAASSKFAGIGEFFKSHGFDEILDQDVLGNGDIPIQDIVNVWGISDYDLFEYAKVQLEKLSQGNKPFLLDITTVNTHAPIGYESKFCEVKDNDIRDQIRCASKMTGDFVAWLKKQPFYKETIIIVAGDHLMMKSGISNMMKGADREILFFVLNSGKEKGTVERKYTAMDMAPTILEMAGFDIKSDKMGLGVSLLSSEKTLLEIMPSEELERELLMRSKKFLSLLEEKRL